MNDKRADVVNGISRGGPRIISWNITLRCPLRCAHCYVDAGELEAEGVLSTGEACAVIDQICETGKPIVVLSGGEPLLRDDVFTIARYGTDRGLRMAMGSSGYLLDKNTAVRLKDSGIRTVAISLDSADPVIARFIPRHPRRMGKSGPGDQELPVTRESMSRSTCR